METEAAEVLAAAEIDLVEVETEVEADSVIEVEPDSVDRIVSETPAMEPEVEVE
jgi:hypothetical protein